MPNHIQSQVEITGTKEAIDKLVKATKLRRTTTAAENYFDFNGIVKMPPELNDTVSPPQVVETQEEADKINAEHKEFPGIGPVKAITKAEAERRLKEYGATTWLDWAYSNWGTKWNAYSVRYIGGNDTTLVIEISTAWGTPTAIWDALEAQGYKVQGVYFGEMEGYEWINEGQKAFDAYVEVDIEYVGGGISE